MLFLIWAVVLITAIYLYFRQIYSVFSKYGVKNPTPVPIIGNGLKVFLGREHMADNVNRIYNMYPDERFYGQYEFLRPLVIVKDIELIKQITIKDFEYFLDHRTMVDETIDPLFGKIIFSMKGQEWKDMRSTLSPAFTSSKIKLMLPLIVEVGNRMVESLKKQIKESNDDHVDIEAKDLTTRYASDVIASCAFGLKVNSIVEENNEFYLMGKEITNFDITAFLKMFIFMYSPWLAKIFRIKLFSDKIANFFRHLFRDTIDQREKHNIVRPDMIHLLMQAKKGKLVHEEKPTIEVDAGFATVGESAVGTKTVTRDWSDDDLIAQTVLFFLAGFETVSTAMSFALYEMVRNPDIQEKLVQEIKENEHKNDGKFNFNSIQNMVYLDMVVSDWSDDDLIAQTVLFFLAGFETVSTAMSFALYEMVRNPDIQEKLVQEIKENEHKNDGKFNFNSIQNMVYLDMVVSEVLRLWAPSAALDRVCNKDYNLGRANAKAPKDYIIRKGDNLQIPTWAIHRDAKFFPNPLKFDPERFSEENKHKILPFSYMPFGLGPRNCIGSRFALCEVKVMLYQVLQHFQVEPFEKTCIPPEFVAGQFSLNLKGGTWIRLKIRQ